ncbi:hypothetical protein BpHYR1_011076 [Brachionus plicatilis]|uniref:Uncharacterized protein n=1 Tax=Brachionus plicatilis TaxID=10195 RepID=A0A3M7RYM3_BRAPC|nr:hypothetical protein BpHYR1_011076 [Brachionus plicatilis]
MDHNGLVNRKIKKNQNKIGSVVGWRFSRLDGLDGLDERFSRSDGLVGRLGRTVQSVDRLGRTAWSDGHRSSDGRLPLNGRDGRTVRTKESNQSFKIKRFSALQSCMTLAET